MANIHIVIPARFGSSRLPGKLLLDLAGKPVIAHTVARAQSLSQSVFVATDHSEILKVIENIGATGVMTATSHNSGTDRLAEASHLLAFDDDDIVVNLQGDEPLMPSQLLTQVALLLEQDPNAGIATLMQPIKTVDDFINPNVVKVVQGEQKQALYFSRAPIPYPRDEFKEDNKTLPKGGFFRHLGIYAYRVSTLKKITQLPEHPLEALEKLEQLRPLAAGVKIIVEEAKINPEHGIDTQQDLDRIRLLFTQ